MSAQDMQGIVDSMTPINSKSGGFNTDPQLGAVNYIKTWLLGKKNVYSINPCLINIDPVLNISTSTTATSTYR
jgi:hypothetical protein